MAMWYLLYVAVVIAYIGSCSCQMIVKSLVIRSDIRYRFATTLVTSKFFNNDTNAQEAVFQVTLPTEAFISNFSMIIEGKEYVGKVKEKRLAKQEYHEAKMEGQSAGYVSNLARHSNKFNIKVNVAAGTSIIFHLSYQQLLARSHGYYEHKLHVNPGQKVDNLKIEIYIQENRDITYLETPGLTSDVINEVDISDDGIRPFVQRPTPKSAYIIYEPSPEEQGSDGFHDRKFLIRYDVSRTSSAGEVLVVDGYFIHFFAPQVNTSLKPLPKDIIFIIDRSGSMSGRKLRQVKTAMKTILKDLREEDRFNIFSFSDRIQQWEDHLVPVSDQHVTLAQMFVDEMNALGGTNIHNAFKTGIQFLNRERGEGHVPIVFFLTDGQASAGEVNHDVITADVKRWNENTCAIFSLAFGYDADYELMKTISAQNDGIARKIYEASDASKQVEGFYSEMSTAVLTGVKIDYLTSPVNLTKTDFKMLFNGTEIVVCGMFPSDVGSQDKFGATITGTGRQGDITLVLPESPLTDLVIDSSEKPNPFFSMPRDYASIVEKSWAYLTIKNLLQKKVQSTSTSAKTDIDKEVLQLSLKYNFVTPLTAIVTTKQKARAFMQDDDSLSKLKVVASMFAMRKVSSHQRYSSVLNSRSSMIGQPMGMPMYSAIPALVYKPQPRPTIHMTWSHPLTTTPRVTTTSAKRRKKNRARKNRKCKNVLAGQLEGIAIKDKHKLFCSKIWRVRAGGFHLLPNARAGTQVSVFFTTKSARFINGLEKVSIRTSGETLHVDVSAQNQPIIEPESRVFNISVANDTDASLLMIKCPDVTVSIYKTSDERRMKCYNRYFIFVQVDTKLNKRRGRQMNVWKLMSRGKTLNKKFIMKPNPVCRENQTRITKLKLKKPGSRDPVAADYVINF